MSVALRSDWTLGVIHMAHQAVSRSTFEFMHTHKDQFDEKLSKIARNEACGLPADAGLKYSKIRAGDSGGGKVTNHYCCPACVVLIIFRIVV